MKIEADNNPIHEAVLFYWGERCPDHEAGCAICDAWKLYDEVINLTITGRVPKDHKMPVVRVSICGANKGKCDGLSYSIEGVDGCLPCTKCGMQ